MLFRKSNFINTLDLDKSLGPPKTVAASNKTSMLSGGGKSPLPTKPDQAGAAAAKCGKCGHYHKVGSICSFDKSCLDGLLSIIKGDEDKTKVGNLSTGIKGHSGGNPNHEGSEPPAPEGKGGQFTSAENAESTTTAVGEGAVPTDPKSHPTAGSGRGSHKEEAQQEQAYEGTKVTAPAMGAAPAPKAGGLIPMDDGGEAAAEFDELAGYMGGGSGGGGAQEPSPVLEKPEDIASTKLGAAAAKQRIKQQRSIEDLITSHKKKMLADREKEAKKKAAADIMAKEKAAKQQAADKKQRIKELGSRVDQRMKTEDSKKKQAMSRVDKQLKKEDAAKQKDLARKQELQTPMGQLKATKKYSSTYDSALKEGWTPEEAHQVAAEASGLESRAGSDWKSPYEQRQEAADAKQAERELAAAQKEKDKADKEAAKQEAAKQKEVERATKEAAKQQADAKKEQEKAAKERAKQEATAQKEADKAEKDKQKQYKKMDDYQAKMEGKQPKPIGTPFSQMYGAGAGIGSSMTQDTGGVGPTAAFAAQRAHQLLNPNLRQETSPTFAGTGTGARTKDRHGTGTSSATAPGQGINTKKSVEDLLGVL